MRRGLLAVVLLVACKSPFAKPTPLASSTASQWDAGSAAPPSAAAGKPWDDIGVATHPLPNGDMGLGCDVFLPPPFREKNGLAGLRLTESGGRAYLYCLFVDTSNPSHHRKVEYGCAGIGLDADGRKKMREAFGRQAKDARDIPGVGIAAWTGTVEGAGQAQVIDDRSPCQLTVGFGPEGPPTDDFARAVLEQFHAAIETLERPSVSPASPAALGDAAPPSPKPSAEAGTRD